MHSNDIVLFQLWKDIGVTRFRTMATSLRTIVNAGTQSDNVTV